MTSRLGALAAQPLAGSKAKRNFILQQGLRAPMEKNCALQYSALQFQPRLVGLTIVVGAVLQAPFVFFALAAVLWWSMLVPRFNPFDALYNRTVARRSGIALASAPSPRRFAQLLAGSFALAIGVSLSLGLHTTAWALEGVLIAAVAALVFGGFCFGSFVFHLLCGRVEFARRTLPWGSGA
jgi:hypothetical protein